MTTNKRIRPFYEKFIIKSLEDFYKNIGIKFQTKTDIFKWLLQYFNFRLRFIEKFNRSVYVSKELNVKLFSNPEFSNYTLVVLDIIIRLKKGVDVNPFQTEKFINAEVNDDLFNDWGIHHLHLDNSLYKNRVYFYNRTNHLLFIKIKRDKAYLIDILDHKSFSAKSLIEIIDNNWSHLLTNSIVPDLPTSGQNYTDDEILILRRKGYTFPININGKQLMLIGDGYSSSGINSKAVSLSNNILRWVHLNSNLEKENIDLFKQELLTQLYIKDIPTNRIYHLND